MSTETQELGTLLVVTGIVLEVVGWGVLAALARRFWRRRHVRHA